jgi:hypothetical protein
MHTAIVGRSNPAHLAQNVAVARKGPLLADVLERGRQRLA